ncbi:MAG: hypothetical protein R3Y59_06865 [bacterium]
MELQDIIDYIVASLPTICACITTIAVPLLIKKTITHYIQKKIDSIQCNIEKKQDEILNDVHDLQDSVSYMCGRQPKDRK